METVRERIIQNIKTTLEGITTTNGYNFDFTPDTVQRWSMHGNKMIDLPLVIISPGDEEEKALPNGFEECYAIVYLDVFFMSEESDPIPIGEYLNRLQGDMKKAILQDPTRGGEAIDTDCLGTTPFETTEGQPYAGIIIELAIRYRHLRLDPNSKS